MLDNVFKPYALVLDLRYCVLGIHIAKGLHLQCPLRLISLSSRVYNDSLAQLMRLSLYVYELLMG